MNKTPNYQLNQWDKSDRIQMEDFNADNAKIEAALTNAGNCKIAVGSYVGTGTYGESNPTTLTFDFEPKIIFLDVTTRSTATGMNASKIPTYSILFRGAAEASSASGSLLTLIWDGKQVSWYYETSFSSGAASGQYNTEGQTYHYIAIG